MNQDLLASVPETAPAEASPASMPRESAFAEHLRLLDHAVARSRERLENQDATLQSLQAQMRRLREHFDDKRRRTAAVLPRLAEPPPALEPAPVYVALRPKVARTNRIISLWP